MTPAERMAVLKARARPTPATPTKRATGLYRAQHPEMPAHPVRVRWVKYPKPTGRGFVSCGPMIHREPPQWVQAADPAAPVEVETKRRSGTPALVKIAAKLLRKRKRGERDELR